MKRFLTLKAYLEATQDTQNGLADALGISQGHMSRLVNGSRLPSRALANRIAVYCGIPVAAWDMTKRPSKVA